MMHKTLYVAACVVLPLVWGLIVVWVSNRIDRWTHRKAGSGGGNMIHPDNSTRIEYHI